MSNIAAITKRCGVFRHLKQLGIEDEATTRAPPKYQEGPFEFSSAEDLYENKANLDGWHLGLKLHLARHQRYAGLNEEKLPTRP